MPFVPNHDEPPPPEEVPDVFVAHPVTLTIEPNSSREFTYVHDGETTWHAIEIADPVEGVTAVEYRLDAAAFSPFYAQWLGEGAIASVVVANAGNEARDVTVNFMTD